MSGRAGKGKDVGKLGAGSEGSEKPPPPPLWLGLSCCTWSSATCSLFWNALCCRVKQISKNGTYSWTSRIWGRPCCQIETDSSSNSLSSEVAHDTWRQQWPSSRHGNGQAIADSTSACAYKESLSWSPSWVEFKLRIWWQGRLKLSIFLKRLRKTLAWETRRTALTSANEVSTLLFQYWPRPKIWRAGPFDAECDSPSSCLAPTLTTPAMAGAGMLSITVAARPAASNDTPAVLVQAAAT